jgi:DNA modification methylase
MRNWIIWHYTFGQQTKNKFARSHAHIFYFTNNEKKFTFNDFAVRIPSDRQLIYNDKRANPTGKIPDDVWNEFPRICGTFKERTQWHPCQMPENLLKKIIAVSSNLGDMVLDPFSGSGTTPAAASQLNRNYCGIDISKKYVTNAEKRLEEIKNQKQNRILTKQEWNELKRLVYETKLTASEITASNKLLKIITNQFTIRMNKNNKYNEKKIGAALKDL